MSDTKASKVKITWVRSLSGAKEPHRRTIEALGLRRLNQSVVKEVTPQIAGMIASVTHLLHVEKMEG